MALYDEDPVRDAEMIAQRWADEYGPAPAGYVGRRRRPDDLEVEPDTMARLVSMHLAFLDGDRFRYDLHLGRALDGLYAEGHTTATAMATIHHLIPAVKAQALEIRAGVDALRTVKNVNDLMRRAQHG